MTQEFKTPNLQFAAWLLAAKLLTYARTETGSRRQQWLFAFLDPDHRGPDLEAQFFNGNPTISIKEYNSAIRLLKEQFVPVTGVRDAAH